MNWMICIDVRYFFHCVYGHACQFGVPVWLDAGGRLTQILAPPAVAK